MARPGLPSNDCKKHGVEKPPDRLVASASHNVFATRTVVLVKVDIWGPGRAGSGMAEAIRTPGSSSEALWDGELQASNSAIRTMCKHHGDDWLMMGSAQ